MKDIKVFLKKKSLKILLLGFSSGLPILLVFSTLSVWLVKAGVDRSTITLFSWAGFAYAFKYLWSPLVDNYKLPIFKKFGHRKSWLLISQILIIFSLILTAHTDPKDNLFFTPSFPRRKINIFHYTNFSTEDSFNYIINGQEIAEPILSNKNDI